MYLVAGLGNPGMKYKNTYHNVGFMTADALAARLNLKFKSTECDAKVAKGQYFGEEIVIAKPQTYMNLSGESIKKLVKKYGIDVRERLIVIYDDADLPAGRMRLRSEGSAGTHNGMRSIVKELGTTEFARLRMGIKTEELAKHEVEIIDFVLSKVDFDVKQLLNERIELAVSELAELISGKDISRVEEALNKRQI